MFALALAMISANAQVSFSGSDYNTSYGGYVDVIGGIPNPPTGLLLLSGSLTISNGAALNDGGCSIGNYAGNPADPNAQSYIGTGTVIVDGTNSVLDNEVYGYPYMGATSQILYQGGISVGGGWPGADGSLTIQNGGSVVSYGRSTLGNYQGTPSARGTVAITGNGSIWTINDENGGVYEGDLVITDGQLQIQNGGELLEVSGAGCSIGSGFASDSILVAGTGSKFILNSPLYFGNPGDLLNTMTIQNGGYVFDVGAYVTAPASILVDGAGSIWTNTAGGGFGLDGTGDGGPLCSLTIQNGGACYTANGNTGMDGRSQLTVTGAGSLFYASGDFNMNDGGSGSCSINVQNSGSVQINGDLGMVSGVEETVTIGAGGTFSSHQAHINGTLTLMGGTLTATFDNGGGSIEIGGPPAILTGNGILNGNVAVGDGAYSYGHGTIAPGDGAGGIGTLTINGNLDWNEGNSAKYNFALGTTSDQVVVSTNLGFNNDTVNFTNAPGFGAGIYTLFTYGGTLNMGPNTLTVGSAPAGFTYRIDTNTPGKVNLILTSNPPKFTSINLEGSNLVLNGASGFPTQTFYIISSTNFTSPLSQWSVVATNQFDGAGNFTFTNIFNANTPQQYYSIEIP